MKIMSHMWYWFLIIPISLWSVHNAAENIRHRKHIQLLEEYIQENHLPTPAYPVQDGEVVFEIEVPVC